MIDSIKMKGKGIIIPYLLQRQSLKQLHSIHMGIGKTHLLARESVNWISMNADTKQTVRQCSKCLEYQCTQPHKTALHHDIPYKPLEVGGADIFIINDKTFFVL